MKPFVLNQHGRIVFPSNFFPELDFSVFETLEQLEAVLERDFEAKAPTGTDILERVESGSYHTRYDLLRDMALNLFWADRNGITMYVKQPMRWRDVPRRREDIFLPALTPWEDGERKIAAVGAAYRQLPPTWDGQAEDRIFDILFDLFGSRKYHATELPAIKPTVAEILGDPTHLTWHVRGYDPDFDTYTYQEILDCTHQVPELEALLRQAMVIRNDFPWDQSQTQLKPVGELQDDDWVVVFQPRSPAVLEFISRVKAGKTTPAHRPSPPAEARPPVKPFPPVEVARRFTVMPRLEAVAVRKGELACSNDDLIRNAAFNWSPMTADEIRKKTGIEERRYTAERLEFIALQAAQAALEKAGREPQEIGAIVFCSCTTEKLLPSVATWLSGELGMFQTHASYDLIAACAGVPYGLAEAVRLLQEVERPVLVVCGEKFSNKIGSVRTSRMIFGDGAAAMLIGPAPAGAPPDIEVVQTYASGPMSEVDSIIWPNPEFDNNITVWGPEVRSLVQRYLVQMLDELRALSLLDAIDLIIPHQANKTMVLKLAQEAGLKPEQLYFNIERTGNTSAASIPLAIYDAVREGVIDRPKRIFAPGFGAGAVGGYAVLRIDPAIVADADGQARRDGAVGASRAYAGSSSEDMRVAFGE
jgi:3-oxoacyl-(acyl-carrier-protein) synthase III